MTERKAIAGMVGEIIVGATLVVARSDIGPYTHTYRPASEKLSDSYRWVFCEGPYDLVLAMYFPESKTCHTARAAIKRRRDGSHDWKIFDTDIEGNEPSRALAKQRVDAFFRQGW